MKDYYVVAAWLPDETLVVQAFPFANEDMTYSLKSRKDCCLIRRKISDANRTENVQKED